MTVQAPFGFMVTNAPGLLPNEGVPLSRLLIAPPEPPPPPQQYGPAPEATDRWTAEETQIALGQLAILLRQIANHLPTAQQQAAATAAPSATATTDPLAFWRSDIGYFFPEKHVDVRFLASGLRPCDGMGMWSQAFEYQMLKLPVTMTVAEMVRRVGVTGRGLQEMVELVVAPYGTQFGPGQVLSASGPLAALTLEQIGWNEKRSQVAPIWVVLGPNEG